MLMDFGWERGVAVFLSIGIWGVTIVVEACKVGSGKEWCGYRTEEVRRSY